MISIKIRPAFAVESARLSDVAILSKAHWPYDSTFIELCRDDLTVSPDAAASGKVFVAEKEDQIIGFYSFSAKASPPEMNNLFVLPEFIGEGVGFQLWSHAIEFARSNGWEYFVMDADPYAAEKFYYKMGCYKIGEAESTVLKGRFIPKLRFDVSSAAKGFSSNVGFGISSDFKFRPLSRSDFPLLQKWLSEPHVKEWWHDDLDMEGIEAKYGPRVDGHEPTYIYVIHHKTKPIGLIQWYLWANYPEHASQLGADCEAAGMDLAIGEKEAIGQGLGALVIHEFVEKIIFAKSNATSVITDPEEKNSRSLRVFEKAGFEPIRVTQLRGEDVKRVVVCLKRGLINK